MEEDQISLKTHSSCIDVSQRSSRTAAMHQTGSTLELRGEGLRDRTSKIKNGTDISKHMKISLAEI